MWLPIDDADAGNGAMGVIPRSHVNAQFAYRHSTEAETNVLTLLRVVVPLPLPTQPSEHVTIALDRRPNRLDRLHRGTDNSWFIRE